jgi:hypothetical protein
VQNIPVTKKDRWRDLLEQQTNNGRENAKDAKNNISCALRAHISLCAGA